MLQLIHTHFWLICIVVTVLNAAIWHWRSRAYIARDPSLADGYRKLIKGVVVYGIVPWVIMGAGAVSGATPSIESYFSLQDMNPFVLAFFGSVVLLWVLGSWWLFARGGAEMLARHPGLMRPHISSPRIIKLVWGLCMVAGVVAVVSIVRADFPVG